MGRHAFHGDAEILDREGHAGKRQLAVDSFGAQSRRIVEPLGDGVDIGAGRLGPRDRRIDKLVRRDLSLLHQPGQAGCILLPQHPFNRHRRPLPPGRRLAAGDFLGNGA